ncbi:MAG: VWA domain-containing protein [SAR324 cluster bacterium]|nr:VWA domain-containing protein [SAR324 cluster bacterium]
MEFDQPLLWYLLLTYTLYLVFWWWVRRSKKPEPSLGFSSLSLLPSVSSGLKPIIYKILPYLRLVGLFFIVLALARPKVGTEKMVVMTGGIAIEMVIDKSGSMNQKMEFEGAEVSRLSVAKKVFQGFLIGDGGSLKGRIADRVGMITFAGFTEEVAPLSQDLKTLAHLAGTVSLASKGEDGTMMGDALYYASLRLAAAEDYLKENGEEIPSKVIILLTDGQQSRGGLDPIEAAQFAADKGIKVYALAIVPPATSFGGGFFGLLNQRLDTQGLEQIASLTGGAFFKAEDGDQLTKIYSKIDSLEKTGFQSSFTRYKEYYKSFLSLGLLLLAIELILDWFYLKRANL